MAIKKNLDISENAVQLIAIEAIKNNSNFKNFAEKILEDYAESLMVLKKPKSVVVKKKKQLATNNLISV